MMWQTECRTSVNSRGLTACGMCIPVFRGLLAPGYFFSIGLPILLLLLAGCSHEISGRYGERSGPDAWASVNGTAVLGKMFEKAGHHVSSRSSLSPWLMKKADCIVWFPNDFETPDPKVREWLEDWLIAEPDRTLIYVGRDFDAEPWYWEHVLPDAPTEQRMAIRARQTLTRNAYERSREKLPNSKDCEWFTLDSSPPLRQIRSLEGEPAWLESIDASKLEIELHSRLTPAKMADVLLKSGEDMLVSRDEMDESRLIVVPNGSFLLNVALVNHEHRKLAAKLIAEVGPAEKRVVFLESDPGGPPIHDDDASAGMPTGMEVFNVWPTNWILLHLAVLGIIFCFSRWPIFGRAWEPPVVGASDFGRHVDALADLLKRSRNRDYAVSRVLDYRQKTEPEK